MAVTSKDIARKLRISQSTVSRALRGDPRVAPDTMARVLEAAEQMNYTPNLAARSLITRKTGTIGVVVSDITNPFYPELLEILHNEFALAGYRTVLFNERTDASPEQHIADLVNGAAADGVIYVSATLGSPLPGRPGGVPVVLVNRYLDDVDVDTVVSDNRRGGRLVAEALVELGHRRIALIAGPENTTTSRDRERGFREQLKASGVEFDEALRRVGQFSHSSGYQWCLDLLASEPRPTAVFAANDVDRVRGARRGAARRRPGSRRAVDRRLRRHRHGGVGRLQPHHCPAAARGDGPGRRQPPDRAGRVGRRRPAAPARLPGRSRAPGHARRRARSLSGARRRRRAFDMAPSTLYDYVCIAGVA